MSFGGQTHLWVNIGCGDRPAPQPWTNCDIYGQDGVELVFDATGEWPFEEGTLERVWSNNSIEHMDHPDGVRGFLGEAYRCLRTGGVLAIVTPDWAEDVHDKMGLDLWAEVKTGMRRWPGDEHRWWPTRHELVTEVRAVFPGAHTVHPGWLVEGWPMDAAGPCDCAVLATKTPR